ncbi:hypothetical protein F4775DRAFT_550395 [Biscogniauxia sp. FL1348]|nr:hypothetical protein F4775DRAFT_550395 [Biscogniauxia sp. FL1348]
MAMGWDPICMLVFCSCRELLHRVLPGTTCRQTRVIQYVGYVIPIKRHIDPVAEHQYYQNYLSTNATLFPYMVY